MPYCYALFLLDDQERVFILAVVDVAWLVVLSSNLGIRDGD
jgi:hypothetical protein